MYKVLPQKLWWPRPAMIKLMLIMRLTTLLLITAILQVSASGFAQKISLSERNSTMTSVLDRISAQTDYDFAYKSENLSAIKNISIDVKNAELKDVLNRLLTPRGLDYFIEDKSVIIFKRSASFFDRLAKVFQAIDVRGRITDKDGQGLPGATISVKNRNQSVTSGADGAFMLSGVDERAVLIVTYIGYQAKEIVAVPDLGNIVLEEAIGELSEVIVNKGYYTESQRLSTGNTVTITAKDIEKQPVLNPLLALQGRATGLQIVQNSGVANGAVNVTIRGRSSLNSQVQNNPLFVIDGVPFQSNLLQDPLGNNGTGNSATGAQGNPLNYINPNDIASIDILKDADATAIYGSRGGNGVILITTKKGKPGQMNLGLNLTQGFMQAPNPLKLMNTQQYLDMRREAFINDGLAVPNIATAPNDPNYDVNGTWSQTEDTDWQEELIGNFAAYTNLNMSATGGSDLTQYTLRGTYNRQGSMFPGKYDDKRGAVNFNLTSFSANKRLKMDFTGNYLKNFNMNAQFDVTPFTLRAPNAPESFKPDGSLNWGGPNSDNANNPYAYTVRSYENKTDNLVLSFRPSYEIIKGLIASANIGLTSLDANIEIKQPQASYSPLYLALSPQNPNLIVTRNQQRTWIAEPQLNYDVNISRLKVAALLGSSFQKSDNEGNYTYGVNFVSDALIGNLANAGTIFTADGGSYLYNYNALYGRLNLNLDDKYIVNLTGRRDGSSKFGPDRQFGNFYSAAMAWIFSSEDFAKDLTFLSLGKLRGSYGTSGNDGIANYAYHDLYSRRTTTYQGGNGFAPGGLANPDVAWEKNAKLEFGLDLAFFNDRIALSSVYYNNRSSNQLISYRLPAMTGFSSIPNYNFPATVENSGWEFSLSSTHVMKRDFQWSSAFNISINRNKLIRFDNLATSSYSSSLEIGQPVTGRALAWVYAGIDANTGLYTVRKIDGTTGSDAGSNIYSGHPVYQTTRILTLPKFFGGLNNTVRYKRLSLDFFLQFVKQTGQQSMVQNAPGVFSTEIYSTGFISSNVPVDFLDRWQKPNDQAKYQRYTQSTAGVQAYNSWQYSDAAYVDASFIRAKNITLSYELPGLIINKLGLKKASVNLSGQNMFTITKFKGRDPETQFFSTLPPLKVFVAGLQINL